MKKLRRFFLLISFLVCWQPVVANAADLGTIIDFSLQEFAKRLRLDLNLLSGADTVTEISPGVYRLHFRHNPNFDTDYQADIEVAEQADGSLQFQSANLYSYEFGILGYFVVSRSQLNYFYDEAGALSRVHFVNQVSGDRGLLEESEYDEQLIFDPTVGSFIETQYQSKDVYDYSRRTLTRLLLHPGDNYDRVWVNSDVPLSAQWRRYFVQDLDSQTVLREVTSVEGIIGPSCCIYEGGGSYGNLTQIETHELSILDFVKGLRISGVDTLSGPFRGDSDVKFYLNDILWDEQQVREVRNLSGFNDKSDNNFLGIFKLNREYDRSTGLLNYQKLSLVLEPGVELYNVYDHLITFNYTVTEGLVTATSLDSIFFPQGPFLASVFNVNYELAPEDILYSLKYMILLPGVQAWRSAQGLRGDLNGDGRVGLSDLAALQSVLDTNWFATENFNLRADFNHDLVISREDVAIMARNFGATTENRLSYAGILSASLNGYRGADFNRDDVIDRDDVDWLESRIMDGSIEGPLVAEMDLNEDGIIDIEDFLQQVQFVDRLRALQATIPHEVAPSPENGAEALEQAAERNQLLMHRLNERAKLFPQDPVLKFQAPDARN